MTTKPNKRTRTAPEPIPSSTLVFPCACGCRNVETHQFITVSYQYDIIIIYIGMACGTGKHVYSVWTFPCLHIAVNLWYEQTILSFDPSCIASTTPLSLLTSTSYPLTTMSVRTAPTYFPTITEYASFMSTFILINVYSRFVNERSRIARLSASATHEGVKGTQEMHRTNDI